MKKLIETVLITGFVFGCGAESSVPNRNAEIASRKERVESYDQKKDSSKKSSDATQGTPDSPFSQFCSGFASSRFAQDTHRSEFELICDGSNATNLLESALVNRAYEEGKDIKLLQLAPVKHNKEKQTTAVTIGLAIKIPVSVQRYFEMMTLFMDDTELAKKYGVKMVDGQTLNETLNTYEGDESSNYHAGWSKHIKVESKVSGQNIVSEYVSRQDHWLLKEGAIYAITGHLEEEIKGIKEARMLSALIQGKTNGYIFTIVHTEAANRGLPEVAESKLIKTVEQGVLNAYRNALMVREN